MLVCGGATQAFNRQEGWQADIILLILHVYACTENEKAGIHRGSNVKSPKCFGSGDIWMVS